MRILLFGTFDHLHPGHLFVLKRAAERARAEGGRLHIVVAKDANVRKIKGKNPKQYEEKRAEVIRTAFPEAHVILGDEADFLAPVRAIRPDLILLGYDQCLPPEVTEADLPCPMERLPAFEPERWKSSLRG